MTDNFRVWFAAGQPAANGVGSSVTFADQAVFKATDDGKFLARHIDCEAPQSGLGCKKCLGFVESTKFASEIASFAYKIDLLTLAQLMCYSSKANVQGHIHLMRGRDYRSHNWAGQDSEQIFKLKPRPLVLHVHSSSTGSSAADRLSRPQ